MIPARAPEKSEQSTVSPAKMMVTWIKQIILRGAAIRVKPPSPQLDHSSQLPLESSVDLRDIVSSLSFPGGLPLTLLPHRRCFFPFAPQSLIEQSSRSLLSFQQPAESSSLQTPIHPLSEALVGLKLQSQSIFDNIHIFQRAFVYIQQTSSR